MPNMVFFSLHCQFPPHKYVSSWLMCGLFSVFSLFSATSVEEIIQKLSKDGSPFALKQLEVTLCYILYAVLGINISNHFVCYFKLIVLPTRWLSVAWGKLLCLWPFSPLVTCLTCCDSPAPSWVMGCQKDFGEVVGTMGNWSILALVIYCGQIFEGLRSLLAGIPALSPSESLGAD